MNSSNVLYSHADRPFYCTQAQAEVLDQIRNLNKGGIGTIHGYVPKPDKYLPGKVPQYDLQFISRFSTPRLYERKRAAIDALSFADVAEIVAQDKVLSALPYADVLAHFNKRKQDEVDSMTKTLDGDRSDAHRQGHDRCYIHIAEGVKVNLVGEKDADGLMQPTTDADGIPTAASIQMMILELKRTYLRSGEKKPVKSGASVLMKNAIEKVLNRRSVGIMSLSLKADNFTTLSAAGKVISADELLTEAKDATEAEKMRLVLDFWTH